MRTLSVLVFAALLTSIGCTTTTRNTTTATKMTDGDLERSIKGRFESVPALQKANLGVSADAGKKEATLSGTVATQSMREQAVVSATSAQPNLTIKDNIKVDPTIVDRSSYNEEMARETRERAKAAGDKLGESLEDAWLHAKITGKLIADMDVPARKINVDVVNDTVTLRGEVDSATAKSEAERIARNTEGVKKVTNKLIVRAL